MADFLMATGTTLILVSAPTCVVLAAWGLYLVHLNDRDQRTAAAKERWRQQDLKQRAKASEIDEINL